MSSTAEQRRTEQSTTDAGKASFVYVTYIKSTAERVWDALTLPEFTRQYWSGHHNASDWKVGSEWRHQDYNDSSKVDVRGNVLESDRPRRLVYSWASPRFYGDPDQTSRVTFDIAEDNGLVRLTVTHDELVAGSSMAKSISGGWPQVLSGLKSLLETGEPLPDIMARDTTGWKYVRFAP